VESEIIRSKEPSLKGKLSHITGGRFQYMFRNIKAGHFFGLLADFSRDIYFPSSFGIF
jgi:hypothetical protein